MAANETPARADAPREAVRPAVLAMAYESACGGDHVVEQDNGHFTFADIERDGMNPRRVIAIDNATGGGLVARVRAALVGGYYVAPDLLDEAMADIAAALGVQP